MYHAIIDRCNPLVKLALASCITGAAALSLAGETVVVKSIPPVKTKAPVSMNTKDFFPQVNPTLSQRNIKPVNPSIKTRWNDKPETGWNGGGVGGTTTSTMGALFPGVSFTGWLPADPQIAVSKTHIVEVVNSDIAFFNKTGTKEFQQPMDMNGFFSGVAISNDTFDPKVFFDKTSNRFVVVILETDFQSKQSGFLIAISDDANPNGNWKKYRIDNEGNEEGTESWLDYEGWGFNKDAIIVTGNMFTYEMGNAGYVQAFRIKKSELLAGAPLTVGRWVDPNSFTIQVAKTDDKTVPFVYGCGLDGGFSTSAIRIFAWRNLTSDTPEMVYTTVSVPDFGFIGTPPSAGGAFLDSLSGRLLDATFKSGSLLTCQTTRARSGTTRAQVSWYEFRPGTWPTSGSPSLFQSGDVALPGDSWAFLPAIHKNNAGDISVMFTRSSSQIIADTMVASRKSTDPKGQMGNPMMLSTSDNTYRLSGRWGDYGSVCVDPSDELTFWGVNMKSIANGYWGTSIVSWKVSTGGGGGGGTGIKPDSVSVLEGSFSAGTLARVQTNDGTTYDSNTVKKPDGSYATAIQTTYTITTAKNAVAGIDVQLKGFVVPSRAPVGYVFLWNYDKSKWDYISAFNLSGSNKAFSGGLTTGAAPYVSTTKKVKVMFRALDPVRRNGYSPAPFKLRSDSVLIQVTPK